jgi:ATP-binding cassette subfamily B protein RaxB
VAIRTSLWDNRETVVLMNPVHLLQFSVFNKVKPILQTEAAECGLACLAMVAYFHGYRIDLNSMRQKFPISLKGLSLQNLINIADKLELTGRAIRCDINELKQLQLPAILHWNMNHYVVLTSVSKSSVSILDPAIGQKHVKLKQLENNFTGVALELQPTQNFTKIDAQKQLKLSGLWADIIGLKSSLMQIFILSLLLQFFAIISPFYMQLVVDDVIVSHDHNLLSILSIGFLFLMLINISVSALRSIVILLLGSQMNIQIATNLLRHLIHLPLDWFQKRHIGDVLSRFGSLEKVKELLTTGIIEAVVDGIMVIGTLVMMFIYSASLAWVVITSVMIYGIFRLIVFHKLRQLNEESLVANANKGSNFIETVKAIQTIKIFNQETERQSIWQNFYADAMNISIRLTKLNIVYKSTNSLIFGVENVVVVYLAATQVINGVMSVGMLFAFMAYKMQFTGKATALVEKVIQFKMLGLHLARIADIVQSPVEIDNSSTISSLNISTDVKKRDISGSIELKNLSFSYSDTEPLIINQLNVKLKAGQSVAIVGASGCGKSTLMKLMLGLLHATSGEVLLDGVNIHKLGVKNYRNVIAAVMQDDQLLSGSIAENISFFDPEFKFNEIESCAKMAAIHNDIMAMPMSYNSLIGDMGSSLSGGQKQRLLLARALYKKPKILFLDEATSHLDTQLEKDVNLSINHLNMTRVIIAHRQETIDSADRVLKMEGHTIIDITDDC